MGGPSAEHEVSLSSGQQMLKHLNRDKYLPLAVRISKSGQWFLDCQKQNCRDIFKKVDLALLALHGEFGEDGKIQALLETHKVPYTGSGIAASALGMDKLASRRIFSLAGLTVPKTWPLTRREFLTGKIPDISFPAVVKPRARGSSVGVSIVHAKKLLKPALRTAFRFDNCVLIENYLRGREVTCGVLDNFRGREHFALPVTEICPVRQKFFDYRAKYTPGASREITPAPLTGKIYKKVQNLAVKAHRVLGCSGYSRSDFIVVGQTPYLLEINTLPGFTRTSLVPQAAAAAGLNFSALLDHIILVARQK